MKINFFVIALLMFFQVESIAQRCGFDALDILRNPDDHKAFEELLRSRVNRNTEDANDVFLIPVVVHVIHNNTSDAIGFGDNISDEQIFSAIEVLNEDFRRQNADTINTPSWARPVAADMQVEFKLASLAPDGLSTNGITRTKGTKNSYDYLRDDEELKGLSYWPSDEYLNIWVADLSNNIIGYAQFPDNSGLVGLGADNGPEDLDGIVVAPFAFGRLEGRATGNNNPYKYGRTAVHEVGHWLGLRHIFNNTGNGCNYTDYCDDTPAQEKSSTGYSECSEQIIGGCAEVIMHQNYMDYTDDFCMNLFTEDQKSRVRKVLEVSPRRAALKFSTGLCGSSRKMLVPSIESFIYDDEFFSNWTLSGSNTELFDWELETGSIKSIVSDSLSADSLVLSSGVVEYAEDANLFLRFETGSQNESDSVRIYYERSCSGNLAFLETVTFSSNEIKNDKISLKGLTSDGLIQFYFVVYNNGNGVSMKDVSLYEESSQLVAELFPNPTNGSVSYKLDLPSDQTVEVQVFDVNGKLVYNEINPDIFSGIYDLDLSILLNGMYIVRFIGEDDTKSLRLQKH